MANITISQLPQATTLTGTELVPIVQNGVTVQTTSNLLAQANTLTQQFLTWGNGSGLANSRYLSGNNGIGLTNDGSQITVALNGVSSTLESASIGMLAKVGATVTPRSIAVSGSGLSVTNGSGQAGNPTINLSTFMQAIANATGLGLLCINSSSQTVYPVSIVGVASQTSVTNGNASGGSSPTVGLASNPVIPGTGSITIPSGTTGQRSGTAGSIRYNTDTSIYEGYNGSAWSSLASGGSVTSITAGTGLTGGTITASGTIAVDTSIVATASNTLTLSNKSISGASNTLTSIPNSALTNNTITINGNTVSLGGSVTIGTGGTSQSLTFGSGVTGGAYTSFNGSTAVTVSVDPTVTATLSGLQTLTNKTINGANNTITNLQNTALVFPYFIINGTNYQLGSTISIVPPVQSTLTLGSGLTGTSYNGSAAVTTTVDNTVVAFLTASQTLTNKTINSSNIGTGTPGTGAFTTLSATGQITSTLADGTAPFVITSTTNVPNLNASSLNGATFAAPGSIGSGTASSGAFTSLSASTITATTSVTIGGTLAISRGAGSFSGQIAIGNGSPLGLNTGSGANIAIGASALASSTAASTSTIVGSAAGRGLLTGTNDGFGGSAVGGSSLGLSSSATGNAGFGYQALTGILGNSNSAFGPNAGSGITTGNYNSIIGQYTGTSAPISATGSNYIVLSDGQGNIRGYFDNSGNFVVNGTSTSGATGVTYANQYVSNVATGTAPFIISSTTQVANLNVAQAGKVTNALTAGSGITFSSGTTYDGSAAITISSTSSFNPASPGPIGGTTPSSGAFTTLSASSTVSGAGFSTYLASPPAIGGSAAAAGTFTTLTGSNDASIHGLTIGLGTGSVATNTALGNGALNANTTGSTLVAVGYQALNKNLTGVNAVAIGYQALYTNTVASTSTAVGSQAAYFLTGIDNDAFGYKALYGVTGTSTGTVNVALGQAALLRLTSGSFNTAVGNQSGSFITTGSNNTILGRYTGSAAPISATGSNYVVLSDGAGNVKGYFDTNGNFVIGTTTNPTGSNGLYVVGPIQGFNVATITSIATASTITPSITIGQYEVTALASAATIAAPSAGVDSQKLLIRIKDNGTAQTLTWTTSSGGYRALGPTLPTTTVVGKPVYIGCVYNAQDTFWDVLAVSA